MRRTGKEKKEAKKGFFKPFCEAKAFTENASLKEKLGGEGGER